MSVYIHPGLSRNLNRDFCFSRTYSKLHKLSCRIFEHLRIWDSVYLKSYSPSLSKRMLAGIESVTFFLFAYGTERFLNIDFLLYWRRLCIKKFLFQGTRCAALSNYWYYAESFTACLFKALFSQLVQPSYLLPLFFRLVSSGSTWW